MRFAIVAAALAVTASTLFAQSRWDRMSSMDSTGARIWYEPGMDSAADGFRSYRSKLVAQR